MNRWHQAWSRAEGTNLARSAFRRLTGTEPAGVWAAPGRVNLIGEHTDYNGGLCLPIALPQRTFVAAAPRTDGRVRLTTGLQTRQIWDGQLQDIAPGSVSGWVAYCGGPAWSLRAAGYPVPGFDLAITSCVPAGAGLSSSAAVGCAVGLALAELAGHPLDTSDKLRAHLATLCVRAENEIAGAPTGGMDQAASLRATAGHALLLDFQVKSARQIPLDLESAGLQLLVIDTRASHALADGQYAARRADCERSAAQLGVDSLREVTDLAAALARIDDPTVRRRVRHVVTETGRVAAFVAAAEAGDWRFAGELMNGSHESLRDDYQVSCTELDVAVEAAQQAGALGARMTGGGFGGSAVALVPGAAAATVAESVQQAARSAQLPEPVIYPATPSGPGGRIDPDLR